MAEDPKAASGSKDLASKIAAAYRSIPADEREKTLHPQDEIENPELDRSFEKLVGSYRLKRPAREKAVVEFPRSAAAPLPQSEDEEPGEKKEYECPECGHVNPGENQFCGMCGAAYDEAVEANLRRQSSAEQGEPMLGTAESAVRHHHHYYHHHHYRNNPYLLLAVALLLAVIAWQQYREFRMGTTAQPTVAPAAQPAVQPQSATTVEPTPSVSGAAQPKENAPAASPAYKSPANPSNSKPAANKTKPAATVVEPVREAVPADELRLPASSPPPPESALRRFMSNLLPNLVPPPAYPPPSPAPPRVTVSKGIAEARVVKRVPPEYPTAAQTAGISGEVVLDALIAKDGSVKQLQVVSGNLVLAKAAMDAVKQWKYQPYLLNGEPVEVGTSISVVFKK